MRLNRSALILATRLASAILVVLLWNHSARSATIKAGIHELEPNRPGQAIEIVVEDGDLVSGIDLFVQIGDGGPGLSLFGLPGGKSAPSITAVELIDGTIFDGVTDSPTDLGSPDLGQVALYSLALIGPTEAVIADGVLARMVIDTTGFYGGSWDLMLDNVLPFVELNGPYATNFAGVPAGIESGRISVAISIGDMNHDGRFGAEDIDALTRAIRDGETDPQFDVNEDGTVNSEDRSFWVKSIARTFFGDSNLDGEFSTVDLVTVFQVGEYEDSTAFNSGWADGDWNADGDFTTSDLVLAFQDGAYERGPRMAAATVPEPAPSMLCIVLFLCLFVRATAF